MHLRLRIMIPNVRCCDVTLVVLNDGLGHTHGGLSRLLHVRYNNRAELLQSLLLPLGRTGCI